MQSRTRQLNQASKGIKLMPFCLEASMDCALLLCCSTGGSVAFASPNVSATRSLVKRRTVEVPTPRTAKEKTRIE